MKQIHLLAATALSLAVMVTSLPATAQMPPPTRTPAPLPTDVAHWVTPALRQWKSSEGNFTLTTSSRIVINPRDVSARATAKGLAKDLASVGGPMLDITESVPKAGDIVLVRSADKTKPESYSIEIADRVTMTAGDDAGLFYAAQSLLQLFKYDSQHTSLPRGTGADWPDYGTRSMMVDIGRKYYEVNQLDNMMREMAWLKMNTLHLHFNDWPAFRLKSEKYPGLAADQAYSRKDIDHLEATAKRYHITIIPELDLPAHAMALTDYRPELGFKCEAMRRSDWLDRAAGKDAAGRAWVIDVTRNENRVWVKDLLNEFIPWFSGPYFHIGGDEYQYDKDKVQCPELMQATKDRGFQYPGDVFVDWINEANEVVKAHGKTTVIWNWWRFKDDKTSIQPNKDIVIETWNTPRLKEIIGDGYSVIVSPEDRLYVVPGIENFDGGGYGLVNNKVIYEDWPLESGPTVKGYSVALWADAGETFSDQYMLGKAYEPMAIMAERTWSGSASPSLREFLARLNKTSVAPR